MTSRLSGKARWGLKFVKVLVLGGAAALSACSYKGEVISATAGPPSEVRPAAHALPPARETSLWMPIHVRLQPATLRLIEEQNLYLRAYLSHCKDNDTGRPHELYIGKTSITASPSDVTAALAKAGRKNNGIVEIYADVEEIQRLERVCISISGGSMIGAKFITNRTPVTLLQQ